jgi:hypothetical protein
MNELVRSSPTQQRHLHRPRYTLSSPYLGVLRADLRTTNRHHRHSHPGGFVILSPLVSTEELPVDELRDIVYL